MFEATIDTDVDILAEDDMDEVLPVDPETDEDEAGAPKKKGTDDGDEPDPEELGEPEEM